MSKERVIIFANGEFNNHDFYRSILKDNDFLIAADAGARHALAIGLLPDLVVGDFDSLDQELLEQLRSSETKVLEYPSEKDEADLELALLKALQRDPREIIILGALGKRIDHLLANLFLLILPLEKKIKARIIDKTHEIYLINQEIKLKGKKGDLISLFPLAADVDGVTTSGLKYPLKNEKLRFGLSRGLSNEFLGGLVTISIRSGLLLIIRIHD